MNVEELTKALPDYDAAKIADTLKTRSTGDKPKFHERNGKWYLKAA